MTTFYFVDGRDADPETKRLMRRHVMKGKNAGKRVHRGSRLALQKARTVAAREPANPLQPVVHYSYPQRVRDMNWIYLSTGSAARSFGNVLHPFVLPFEVTADSLQVINKFFTCIVDQLYPAYLGLSLHDSKLLWLKLLSTDAETNVCSMYLMRSCIEHFEETGNPSTVAFHHLSQAFTIVNRRMQGQDALSNSTLVLVMFLVNHEYIRKEFAAATMHLEGLARMVELRGGLTQLEKTSDRYLLLKLCKTDVIYCLQFGAKPRFWRDRLPEVRWMLQSQGLVFRSDFVTPPGLDPEIASVLKDVVEVCDLFNSQLGRNRTLDSASHLEIVISVFYRLLNFSTLLSTRDMSIEDAIYHTGLLTLMATIFLPRYGHRIIPYEPIAYRMRHVIETMLVDEENSKTKFWLMILCCIWLAGEADTNWLALRTRDAANDLAIKTWGQACRVLETFPWLINFHGDVGQSVWKAVQEGRLH